METYSEWYGFHQKVFFQVPKMEVLNFIFGYFVGGFSIKPYPYSFLLVRIDPINLVTFCEPSFSWVFKETNMQVGG